MNKSLKDITFIGIFAALYAVLTIAIAPLSYGVIQFRASDILTIACIRDKRLIPAFTIGCFIANLFSPLGLMDVVFGTAATLCGCFLLYAIKLRPLAIVASATSIAAIVGSELQIAFGGNIIMLGSGVLVSELIALFVGYSLMPIASRVRNFRR